MVPVFDGEMKYHSMCSEADINCLLEVVHDLSDWYKGHFANPTSISRKCKEKLSLVISAAQHEQMLATAWLGYWLLQSLLRCEHGKGHMH